MRVGNRTGRLVLAVLAAGTLTACRDVGLEFNEPREEAENLAFRYAVYEAAGNGQGVTLMSFEQRNWMASGAVERIPESALRAVGMASGTAVFAPTWETAPFDRLYVRSGPDEWHPVTPVQ
jgi:hypothetical protein